MAGSKQSVRISVSKLDQRFWDWLDAQSNRSLSIWYLIRQDEALHGATDVLCRDVFSFGDGSKGSVSGTGKSFNPQVSDTKPAGTGKRGRPSKKKLTAKSLPSEKKVSAPSTPVSKTLSSAPSRKEEDEEYDVMDMLRLDQTPSQTFGNDSSSGRVTDDDGVVDPEKLLGL